jgi:Amt family ammonium transporter
LTNLACGLLGEISSGDTAFVLICAAMVMLMTPGLAFFYGGMVRRKNILGVLMQCFVVLCVLSLQWVLVGYSLSFSEGNGFIGSLKWFGLSGIGVDQPSPYAQGIPHLAFVLFQGMFAVITPALIVGAFAERMKFSAFLVFTLLWATLVYDPIAHWVWGKGGWLAARGALDFAGGTVVHINAGVAALVTALIIGRRKGYDHRPTPPHNLPFTVLGAALLWFGWFGFNGGSALGANGLAASAFLVTHTAAGAAGLTWGLIEWIHNGKPTMFGTVTGAVGGLVAITPAAGYVTPLAAIAIGIIVSLVCFLAVSYLKPRLGYDDSLDAFGVHGVGGMWGAIATGLFASRAVNPSGGDGLFVNAAAGWGLLGTQLLAVGATLGYSLGASLVLYKLVDLVIGVRVSEHEEAVGLDLTQHREAAYTVLE